MNVKGKVIIVTGASSGIGLAAAKLLSKQGAKLALVARSKDKLSQLEKELPDSLAVPTDMLIEKEIKEMVKNVFAHFGRIDILINNAGRGYDAPLELTNIAYFHKLFDLDVVGPVIAMQAVIPYMKKQSSGSIINISSGTALMYLPNMSAYSSMKRALAGISLTAREELKKDHINVSVMYPYITVSDFEKNMIGADDANTDSGAWEPDPPADSSEHVAGKILDLIISEAAEEYAHDWMKKSRG